MRSAAHRAKISRIRKALSDAESLDRVVTLRAEAESVLSYARAAGLGLGIENEAVELKLRAERKAGKILAGMHLRGGSRRSNTRDEKISLKDLGISHNQSFRWQLEAAVPESQFEQYIQRSAESGKHITAAGLLRIGK